MHYRYIDLPVAVLPHQLQGFFVGWSQPPSLEKHHELLRKSDYCVLALDENGKVVGFITAIVDHVLTAYINFLEVLPEHQNPRGRGTTCPSPVGKTAWNIYH